MAEPVILVTGATGAIGPRVVRACLARGYSVRTLSTGRTGRLALPSSVDMRVGDICDIETVRTAVAGVDVIVHLAALLHQFEDVPELRQKYARVNVGGTENIVRCAVAEGVQRIVFLSTIAVYGSSRGDLIDENTRPHPDTEYGKTKLAAEQVALSATSGGQPIATVLRAAATYGSRVKGNYRRLAMAIARRRFVPIGPCLNRRTIVNDHDLAEAILLAARHPAAAGGVFNVSDGHVHTLSQIIDAIYRGLHRHRPRFHVPLALARTVAGLCESTGRATGLRSPLTKALLEKYAEDIAVRATLIHEVLGFTPAVDLDRGWRETMAVLPWTPGEC